MVFMLQPLNICVPTDRYKLKEDIYNFDHNREIRGSIYSARNNANQSIKRQVSSIQ